MEVYYGMIIYKELKSVPGLVNIEHWRLEISSEDRTNLFLRKYFHREVLTSSVIT